MKLSKAALEALYRKYNRREFVHPDPLEFLYHYSEPGDREIVGIIASTLAYGNVKQILKSVAKVLCIAGKNPRRFLLRTDDEAIKALFRGFKHRFTTGAEMAGLLLAIKNTIKQYGSLKACFLSGLSEEDKTVIPALSSFVKKLYPLRIKTSYLVPSPEMGSACKRLNLFLRWMVRRDDVDPGGWDEISPSLLIYPIDTHMHQIGRRLGLTRRKHANLKSALEITEAFLSIAPHDPVKYDFALTRLGIRNDTEMASYIHKLRRF